MKTYFIHEANLERLEKKLITIQNKCKKQNTSFTYIRTGNEEYREVQDENGRKFTARFVEVAVEGSVHHGPWQFVAVLEHKSSGNVIRSYNTDLEVPERYRTCGPTCEHCQKIRSRKDTYVIYNRETEEFKQVGTGCLNEYTNGLDAEDVARHISWFDTVISGESIGSYSKIERYYKVFDILLYAFETVKHFGYTKSEDIYYHTQKTTRERVFDYYLVGNGETRWWMSQPEIDEIKDEMRYVKFDASSQEETVKSALAWIQAKEATGSYIGNLKVICAEEYCNARDLGILISLTITYKRAIADEAARAQKELERSYEKASEYLGSVGDKIQFTTSKIECVWSGSNMYGISYMYKMTDINGNILMWSTDKSIDIDKNFTVSCSIKKLEEFRSVKQTWVTRCRLTAA